MKKYCIAFPCIFMNRGSLVFICITETREQCEEVRKFYNLVAERTIPKEYYGPFPCFCRILEEKDIWIINNGPSFEDVLKAEINEQTERINEQTHSKNNQELHENS